jgi:Co/Zn/Cd efflux system component
LTNADNIKLNDIISLLVGLWAVKVAQKATSDKYSFGVCMKVLWAITTNIGLVVES